MIKYRMSEELLVAQKGIKGFRKTSVIGEFTTLIGTRSLPVLDDFVQLVKNLIPGYNNGFVIPTVFKLENLPKVTNNISICDFSDDSTKYKSERVMVFKYALNIKIHKSGDIDFVDCLLVDNLNRRFLVQVSSDGTIQKMKLIKVHQAVVETKTVAPIIKLPEQIEIPERTTVTNVPFSVIHRKVPEITDNRKLMII